MKPSPASSASQQQQRRAATRLKLLNATLDCLVNDGYPALSTRNVAERAGLSQGALQHHFRSKAALVDAAVTHMVDKMLMQAQLDLGNLDSDYQRAQLLIDILWASHNLPLTKAVLEMLLLTRHDGELASTIKRSLEKGTRLVHAAIAAHIPTLAALPGFERWLYLTEATIRGTVIMTSVPGLDSGYAPWPEVRAEIVAGLDRLVEQGASKRA